MSDSRIVASKPVHPMDRDKPNGDLKPGDHFLIETWCGERAFIRVISNGLMPRAEYASEPGEDTKPNPAYRGDILRIDAIQYPHALATVWTPNAPPSHAQLDLRTFNAVTAELAYMAAVKASASAPVCSCPSCRRSRRRWYKPWTWGR